MCQCIISPFKMFRFRVLTAKGCSWYFWDMRLKLVIIEISAPGMLSRDKGPLQLSDRCPHLIRSNGNLNSFVVVVYVHSLNLMKYSKTGFLSEKFSYLRLSYNLIHIWIWRLFLSFKNWFFKRFKMTHLKKNADLISSQWALPLWSYLRCPWVQSTSLAETLL